MSSDNLQTENGGRASKGIRLYFVLLSVQTIGVAILLANIVPVYRLMSLNFSSYKPEEGPWWAIAGIVVAQVAYWFRVSLQPPLPRKRHVVSGHIVAFLARLIFVSVTASFSLMFLNRFPELKDLNYPPIRALVILVMFFAIFCWVLELERVAKALQEGESGAPGPAPTH